MYKKYLDYEGGSLLGKDAFSAGGYNASIASAGGRLLGFAEQFRLGLGHGQINLSATLALRRNRTLRVRPAYEYEKGSPKGAFRTHGGSRTHDPLLRRQLLYPTELRVLLDRASIVLENFTISA